jgi:hypothetical protein
MPTGPFKMVLFVSGEHIFGVERGGEAEAGLVVSESDRESDLNP